MNNLIFNIPIQLPFLYRLTERIRDMLETIRDPDLDQIGRERHFADVMKEYSSVISGICFSYATNAEDLKDLRQDIMLNIWKGLPYFRGKSALSTWIYRVALNTCVSTVRKRSKQLSTVSLETLADSVPDPESGSREHIDLLHSLISGLSPLDKAVITMWLDDRKYSEIAEVTGISRNNVAVRINRIKNKLYHKLSPVN